MPPNQPSVPSGRRCCASLSRLRDRIDARAAELRREVPCLAHTDANFHNIIVATDHVTLIDWDNPAVRYPLEELEALEEHPTSTAYPSFPPRSSPATAERCPVRCYASTASLGAWRTFSSTEWSDLAADTRYPRDQRSMIRGWNEQLRDWIYRIDDHLDQT